MVGREAEQFSVWLEADGLIETLDPYSHAHCALPTKQSVVLELNSSVRGYQAPWYGSLSEWPDDDWIVGEMGNGDYYFISRGNQYAGVWQYHHELREKECIANNLREFYEYCVNIEREAGNL